MDRSTLAESRGLFAISQNVANRLARFNGLAATPLYPPLRPAGWHSGPYGDYIFSLARLDAAKRLDLLKQNCLSHRLRNGPENRAMQERRAEGVCEYAEARGRGRAKVCRGHRSETYGSKPSSRARFTAWASWR